MLAHIFFSRAVLRVVHFLPLDGQIMPDQTQVATLRSLSDLHVMCCIANTTPWSRIIALQPVTRLGLQRKEWRNDPTVNENLDCAKFSFLPLSLPSYLTSDACLWSR